MALLGSHMSASGGLDKAVGRADELGIESMQIFTRSPLQWGGRPMSELEIGSFRRALLSSGVRSVVSHASYLLNLAGDDGTRERSIRALSDELSRCEVLGIDSVVLHPGSAKDMDREAAKSRLADALSRVLSGACTGVRILLETMAGQGEQLGTSVEELADVIEMLDWDDRLGVCCDTCHMFAAGLDIRTAGGYERMITMIDRQVGVSRVGCWHMSDSRRELGARIDRHEHLGDGEIGIVPFAMLVTDERFASTPVILETPKKGIGDEGNLALLRKSMGAERSGGVERRC